MLDEMGPLSPARRIAAQAHRKKTEDRHVGALWEMHDDDAHAIGKRVNSWLRGRTGNGAANAENAERKHRDSDEF